MAKAVLLCAAIFAVLAASAPAFAAEDCAARIWKLNTSNAEGDERLAEKNKAIDVCAGQYARDAAIQRLVKACAKYEEQPIVKQQAVAECEVDAFRYANDLRGLKADYKK